MSESMSLDGYLLDVDNIAVIGTPENSDLNDDLWVDLPHGVSELQSCMVDNDSEGDRCFSEKCKPTKTVREQKTDGCLLH